jgi:DNA-binding transcriptional regulator YdaS (Cro superfamily)
MDKKLSQIAREAIITAGGVAAVARALGITQGSVSLWQHHHIPAKRVLDMERLSGIPRTRLRPDIFGASDNIKNDTPSHET